MNFLKKLFGDDDDKPSKRRSRPAPRPSRTPSPNIQQMAQVAQQAWDNKPLEEIVQILVGAPAATDWREAQMSGGSKSASKVKQAWSALEAIQKRTDSQAVFDALIAHINIVPSNLQYQRALASVGEEIAVAPLLTFAKSGEQNERLNALKALAEMYAGTAAEGLVTLLDDDDPDIRTEVVRALGFSGHPLAHNALQNYDHEKYPINAGVLGNAKRWCNVPDTLEEFRRRTAKGEMGIGQTLERLEDQYAKYWQDTSD